MNNEQIVFSVRGSSDLYEVVFSKSEELYATCTCSAGQLNKNCKHRFSILTGDDQAVVSDNKPAVQTVLSWLQGTKLARGIIELAEAERDVELAKKRIARAKQALGRIMQP